MRDCCGWCRLCPSRASSFWPYWAASESAGSAWVGVGSVGGSLAVVPAPLRQAHGGRPRGRPGGPGPLEVDRCAWLPSQLSLSLDSLSLVMILVVTGVGFLIHLYSSEFMEDDEGYSRFFAYMNLFVGPCWFWSWPEPAGPLPGLGGSGPVLLPAHRVLVPGSRQRSCGPEGLHRHPGGRHGPGRGAVSPSLPSGDPGHCVRHGLSYQPVACGVGDRRSHGSASPGGSRGQVGPAPVADLAPGRHGRTDAGLRPHPRRHHGDGGRVSDCPDPRRSSSWPRPS